MSPLIPHVEPELEALLLRVAPDIVKRWKPATPEQIAEIEGFAGRPLPPFYRWYLSRMGQDNGRIAAPFVDFDVARVLEYYREGEVARDDGLLLIGIDEDDISQAHPFYELYRPLRDDCLVGTKELDEPHIRRQYETFREMIAWGAFFRWRVRKFDHQCLGMAASEDGGAVAGRLKKHMRDIGFSEPVTGGDYFGIFDRADAAMASSAPMSLPPHTFGFTLGGDHVASMRRVLGELGLGTGLKISVDEWTHGT
jgi:hypothetical protein